MFDKPIVVNDKQILYSDDVVVDHSEVGDIKLYFYQPVLNIAAPQLVSMIGMPRKAAEKLHEILGKELGKD